MFHVLKLIECGCKSKEPCHVFLFAVVAAEQDLVVQSFVVAKITLYA